MTRLLNPHTSGSSAAPTTRGPFTISTVCMKFGVRRFCSASRVELEGHEAGNEYLCTLSWLKSRRSIRHLEDE